MKGINLLPPNIAFNYKKFLITRLSVFIIVLNVILLFFILLDNVYINKKLEAQLTKRKSYLSQINNINSTFGQYKKEYVALKKKLAGLKEEIEYYEKTVVLHRSAYTDSIVFVNTFYDGVWFDSVSYNNGVFNIRGYAPSKVEFQKFYGALEKDKYVADTRFFYVKEKDGKFVFKINYRVVFRLQ